MKHKKREVIKAIVSVKVQVKGEFSRHKANTLGHVIRISLLSLLLSFIYGDASNLRSKCVNLIFDSTPTIFGCSKCFIQCNLGLCVGRTRAMSEVAQSDQMS